MEINRELMRLIEERTQHMLAISPYHIYTQLWKHWPQINPNTKLLGTTHHEVNAVKFNSLPALPRPMWHNKPGRKARFWRSVGELFNRHDWWMRGRETIMGLQAEPLFRDVVRLEKFGVFDIYSVFQIECGYHAATDTLYIRDYVRPLPEENSRKAAEFDATMLELRKRLP